VEGRLAPDEKPIFCAVAVFCMRSLKRPEELRFAVGAWLMV
jgi:hypothetical protein